MLRHLDRPVLLDRTPRELLLIAGGLGISAYELSICGPNGNIATYLLFTAALVVRFYAARAILVGLIVGAVGQVLPAIRLAADPWRWLGSHAPLIGLWVGGLALLCSRDLVRRFDRAPSRHRWLPNYWAALDPSDARRLRWSGYAIGAAIGGLVQTWRLSSDPPSWLLPLIIAISICGALLVLGRAVMLLALPALAITVVALFAPQIGAAETQLAARWGCVAYTGTIGPLIRGAHFVLPITIAASAAAALALPYAWRVLRRLR